MSDLHTDGRRPSSRLSRQRAAAQADRAAASKGEQLRLLGSAIHVTAEGIAIMTPAVEAVGPRIAFVNDGFCAHVRPRARGRHRPDAADLRHRRAPSVDLSTRCCSTSSSTARSRPKRRRGGRTARSSSSTCSSCRSRTPDSSRTGWPSSATSPRAKHQLTLAAPPGHARRPDRPAQSRRCSSTRWRRHRPRARATAHRWRCC